MPPRLMPSRRTRRPRGNKAMLQTILWGLGLVLVIEGLAYALAPSFMKELMERMRHEPVETLRVAGFGALVIGTFLVVLSQMTAG